MEIITVYQSLRPNLPAPNVPIGAGPPILSARCGLWRADFDRDLSIGYAANAIAIDDQEDTAAGLARSEGGWATPIAFDLADVGEPRDDAGIPRSRGRDGLKARLRIRRDPDAFCDGVSANSDFDRRLREFRTESDASGPDKLCAIVKLRGDFELREVRVP